jgi:hypothetical protein
VHSNFISIKKTRLALHLLSQKTLRGTNEDKYPGHMIEMTLHAHVGVGIDPYYNKMTIEYLLKIESYSNKIKSCN